MMKKIILTVAETVSASDVLKTVLTAVKPQQPVSEKLQSKLMKGTIELCLS